MTHRRRVTPLLVLVERDAARDGGRLVDERRRQAMDGVLIGGPTGDHVVLRAQMRLGAHAESGGATFGLAPRGQRPLDLAVRHRPPSSSPLRGVVYRSRGGDTDVTGIVRPSASPPIRCRHMTGGPRRTTKKTLPTPPRASAPTPRPSAR